MSTTRRAVLVLAAAGLTAAGGLLAAGPAAAAPATGWTPYPSSYATSRDTPRVSLCLVSSTDTRTTLRVRAVRRTQVPVSFAVAWGPHGGSFPNSTSTDTWRGDVATLRVALSPRADMVVSWQSSTTGFAYHAAARPPAAADLAHCG